MTLGDSARDLLGGGRCVGCGTPGRPWCRGCDATVAPAPDLRRPTPCPPGLAPSWSAGEYDGALRHLVVAHKDRGILSLRRPLGARLAVAVAAGTAPVGPPLVLVPVPSSRAATRRRGHDPLLAVVTVAARLLRDTHRPRVASLLVSRGDVADQAGLDASSRAHNLRGSMWCPSRRLASLARRGDAVRLVLCDDVLTTGSTAREAQRALAAVGVPVVAIATVAATRRRSHAGHVTAALSSRPAVG